MPGTSSFSTLDTQPAALEAKPRANWRSSTAGALDAAAFSIPLSLGSAALVFSHVGPGLLASGVLAAMLAIACIHFATAHGQRPVIFAARFFEATTLAAMMDQVVSQIPLWGLADTRGVRLAFLCLIAGIAGIWMAVLYLMRADRFTRYIPAPVFAGFSNSIAVALIVSQTRSLWELLGAPGALVPVLSITLLVLATGLAVRYWRPRWPSAAVGLLVGALFGAAWLAMGKGMPMVSASGWSMTLPFMLADFQAFGAPGVKLWPVAVAIAIHASILGTMVFINTTLTSQLMTQSDERKRGLGESVWMAAVMALGGAAGSVPISGSAQSSSAASRITPLSGRVMVLCGATAVAIQWSGLLAWIPLAALCGALLCEAWLMVDRPSVLLLKRWVSRAPMEANAKEDLALVAAVTGVAVFFNMVAAVFIGLLLGLVLFAMRNARRPVRYVWTGSQLHSNCARSRADLRALGLHGDKIKVLELEGDLFFGSVEQLEQQLRTGLQEAQCAILDWSRVSHIDTSVADCLAKAERKAAARGLRLIHAGAEMRSGNVGPVLTRKIPGAFLIADLDHALEHAENHLLKLHGAEAGGDFTTLIEAASLFRGLDEAQRGRLEQVMEQKLFTAGQIIVAAGDAGDELMLVLHGSASIMVRSMDGHDIRLAGVRRGATIGEIGFLDQAPRSATVIAQEDVAVAILRRDRYDALSQTEPALVQQLLANIAVDMASRLRHTNRTAIARTGRR